MNAGNLSRAIMDLSPKPFADSCHDPGEMAHDPRIGVKVAVAAIIVFVGLGVSGYVGHEYYANRRTYGVIAGTWYSDIPYEQAPDGLHHASIKEHLYRLAYEPDEISFYPKRLYKAGRVNWGGVSGTYSFEDEGTLLIHLGGKQAIRYEVTLPVSAGDDNLFLKHKTHAFEEFAELVNYKR